MLSAFAVALLSVVLHVLNYNGTAHLEYNTRFFTKILGRHAVYYYAVYLVCSALIRDSFIASCLEENAGTLEGIPSEVGLYVGYTLFVSGILLNLWTLKALGIKGMYNGDSFGFLMDEPVTSGPYLLFNDPQYVGTTIAMLGSALTYLSLHGLIIAAEMGLVFYISVKFIEGPHMRRIYANKDSKKKKK